MSDESTWNARLRELRKLLGWSQRRLAKELRVTPGAVSQWESAQRAIPGPVKRLVEIYERNMSVDVAASTARSAAQSLRGLLESHAYASEIRSAAQDAVAAHLAIAFGNMKGLPSKLAKIAAHVDFAVPQQVRDALRGHEPPALSERAIAEAVRRSLGDAPDRIFARWEPRPFAVASIGQVHRARLDDGTEVAVKVQFPGIRRAIERDLVVLEALLGALWGSTDAVVADLRAGLLNECDYMREADHQEEIRAFHAGVEDLVVARVHRQRSSRTVLTSDFIDAPRFEEFVRDADQATKDRAGAAIFSFVARMLYRHGLFHGNPHPSNYLFPKGAVAVLDFGGVRRVPPEWVRTWGRYVRAVLDDRRADADDLFVELGFVGDRDRFDFGYHHRVARQIFEPWLSAGPYRFDRHLVERNYRAMVVDNPNLPYMALTPQGLVLQQLAWGTDAVLADLGAAAPWRDLFEEHLSR